MLPKIIASFGCLLLMFSIFRWISMGNAQIDLWFGVNLCPTETAEDGFDTAEFVSYVLTAAQTCPSSLLASDAMAETFFVPRSQFDVGQRYMPVVLRSDNSNVEYEITVYDGDYRLLFQKVTTLMSDLEDGGDGDGEDGTMRRLLKSGGGGSFFGSSRSSRRWGRSRSSFYRRTPYGGIDREETSNGTLVHLVRNGPRTSGRGGAFATLGTYSTDPRFQQCDDPAVGCYFYVEETLLRDEIDASFELFGDTEGAITLSVKVLSISAENPAAPSLFVTFVAVDGTDRQKLVGDCLAYGCLLLGLAAAFQLYSAGVEGTLAGAAACASAVYVRLFGATFDGGKPFAGALYGMHVGMWMEFPASFVDGDRLSTRLEADDAVDGRTTSLDMSNNDIVRIEGLDTPRLPCLARLVLSTNNLPALATLDYLRFLRYLDVSNNDISTIDPRISEALPVLEHLDLSDNDLAGTLNLASPSLTWLSVYNNDLKSVRGLRAPQLRYFNASSNDLTNVTGLSDNIRLEDVVLDNNDLCDAPSMEALATNLLGLSLVSAGNNDFTSIQKTRIRNAFRAAGLERILSL